MTGARGVRDAVLPDFLRPAPGVPLVRLGSPHDGGYVIDGRNPEGADLLLSFGVNDDWAFEADFLARHDVPLAAWDGSVSAWEFFMEFYVRVAKLEPGNARAAWRLFRDFRRFFRGPRRVHHRRFVGEGPRHDTLAQILARPPAAAARRIFLKIDVEGAEYGLLETLVAEAHRIEGLTVEFHDIDRDMARLRDFVAGFPLTLCHTHANNMGRVLDDGLPVVIECSFTRQPAGQGPPVTLPHALDRPNLAGRDELRIRFSDD